MASKTPNYNLEKPFQDDFYNVDVFNGNSDIIDTELKRIDDKTKVKTADSQGGPVTEKNINEAVESISQKVNKVVDDVEKGPKIEHIFATATVPASGWSKSAPYTQTVTVPALISSDKPTVDVYISSDVTARDSLEAFGAVQYCEAVHQGLKLKCYDSIPAYDFQIQIEVIR